jgi:hypothetical protein
MRAVALALRALPLLLAEFGAEAATTVLAGCCLAVVEKPSAVLRLEVKKP